MVRRLATVAAAALGVGLALVLVGFTVGQRASIGYCGDQVGVSYEYLGNTSGFLSLPNAPMPAYCVSERVPLGAGFDLYLSLHSSDHTYTHVVRGISVESPYGLGTISPAVPMTIGPGMNLTFELGLTAPTTPGDFGSPVAVVAVA